MNLSTFFNDESNDRGKRGIKISSYEKTDAGKSYDIIRMSLSRKLDANWTVFRNPF